jgi:D-alanine--D-alanine ligase
MIRIGIFMGGASLEKEVSFNSGRTIYDYVEKEIYNPIPIFITEKQEIYLLPWRFLYRGKISDFENRLEREARLIPWHDLSLHIDFAFLALHGKYGEDGCIQGLLELLKIPYSGSSILSSALSTNKLFINKLLASQNITIPQEIKIKKKESYDKKTIERFLFEKKKIIIKPGHEGSSIGVSRAENFTEFEKGFEYAKFINGCEQDVLIQEYIEGKEFSVVALEQNDEWIIFDPTEIEFNKTFFTYEEKYLPGAISKYTPARFSSKIISLIKETIKKIITFIEPQDIIRIDGILQANTEIIYIIDVNSFPGTAPNSFTFIQAAQEGITPANFINTLLKNSLEKKNTPLKIIKKEEGQQKKLKIGIMLGGISNEKEISLESGRNVFYKLPESMYDKTVLFFATNKKFYRLHVRQIVKDTTQEIENSLLAEDEIPFSLFKELFDFIFIGLHGGEGEDGTIQKKLEIEGIPFNGSTSAASKLCMNKNETLLVLEKAGIRTTKRLLINKKTSQEEIIKKIEEIFSKTKNFIIKPNDDGCSALVFFAKEIDELLKLSTLIFESKEECLIEEYIDDRELTVGVLGNKEKNTVLPITEAKKSKTLLSLEEKFLPGAGENITPAEFNDEDRITIQKTIKDAYEAIGCDGYARIDCFWKSEEKKLIILECNSLPALTPATCFFHQTAELEINPTETLEYIIYLGLLKHSKNHQVIEFMKTKTQKTTKKIQKLPHI